MTIWQTINGIDLALIAALLIALYKAIGYRRAWRAAIRHLSPKVVADLKRSKSSLDLLLHDIRMDIDTVEVRQARAILRQRDDDDWALWDNWDALDG